MVEPVVVSFERVAECGQPLIDLVERGFGEAAGAAGSVNAGEDEAGVFENPEVLGHGGLGDLEGLGELGDRGFAESETGEDGASGGVGEGGEGGVEVFHNV